MKVVAKVCRRSVGHPIDSYILKNGEGTWRVSRGDTIRLAKDGWIKYKVVGPNKVLVLGKGTMKVFEEQVGGIERVNADTIRKLIYEGKKRRVRELHGIDIVKKGHEKRRVRGNKILIDSAIINSTTNKIIGYRYTDGNILAVNSDIEDRAGYQERVTQTTMVSRRAVLKNKKDIQELEKDIADFNETYGGLFRIQTTKFQGRSGYIRIELFREKYTIEHAKVLKKSGVIKDIVTIDEDIDSITSNEYGQWDIIKLLGYKYNSDIDNDGTYNLYNDDFSKRICVVGDDLKALRIKTDTERNNYGIAVSKNTVGVYDPSHKVIELYAKKNFVFLIKTRRDEGLNRLIN